MQNKYFLEAEDAARMLEAAAAEAATHQWAVTIAVVDDGGHLLALRRLDHCNVLSVGIAIDKARVAALGRRETSVYEGIINNGRSAFLSVGVHGFLEGGVPVLVAGQVVGAIGVSGVRSPQDAQVAKTGAAAL